MKRREFITLVGGVATWPVVARAQQSAMPVVGVLDNIRGVDAFRTGSTEAGYFEGRNVALELQATDQDDRLPALATELVRRQVSVIAALSGPSASAAKAATAVIPIVFSIGGDPVEVGLVGRLNRPGGNITGATFFAAQLLQKQAGLLRELIPKAAVLGFLVNPDNPRAKADVTSVEAAAHSLGLTTHIVKASAERDLDSAFASLVRGQADALIIGGDTFILRAITNIAALAARHAIPAVFGSSREYLEAGGLMTYGARLEDARRQAGIYTGRILKGEKPGDLPVIQPTKFEFVLNLRTAKTLGLSVSSGVLSIADRVIE